MIYLVLNMLVIPALTLSGVQGDYLSQKQQLAQSESSLWKFAAERGFNPKHLLSEFYLGDNGVFFTTLIL